MPGPDPRDRFSGAAGIYARARPGYPDALVDWVLGQAGVKPGDRVADVGCGTGIFTRLLAARGLDAVGIDPNEDMLKAARDAGGPASYARGEGAATGLAPASVALVTVAQAFHWIEVDPALDEFSRVLRPQGRVAAVWNIRAEGGVMADFGALLRRFSREYQVIERWETTIERLRQNPRVLDPRFAEWPNLQRFDFEGLHARAWSASYVIHGVDDREGFDSGLRDLFAAHAREGVLDFPYRAVALVFEVAAASSSSAIRS